MSHSTNGFTLAELLIALAILGLIATFAIPQLINAQQNGKSNAIAHEVAGSISEAYRTYKNDGGDINGKNPSVLMPYLNYVAVQTSGSIDSWANSAPASVACSGASPCYMLHNGAVVRPWYCNMTGIATTNAVGVLVDPDGVDSGVGGDGPSRGVLLLLYYNGRLASKGNAMTGTTNQCGTFGPNSIEDPSWFHW